MRDRISTDTWRVLASIDDELSSAEQLQPAERLAGLSELLNRLVQSLSAFSGLVMESMSRGQAWRFLDMGRRLERAMTLVSIIFISMARVTDKSSYLKRMQQAEEMALIEAANGETRRKGNISGPCGTDERSVSRQVRATDKASKGRLVPGDSSVNG